LPPAASQFSACRTDLLFGRSRDDTLGVDSADLNRLPAGCRATKSQPRFDDRLFCNEPRTRCNAYSELRRIRCSAWFESKALDNDSYILAGSRAASCKGSRGRRRVVTVANDAEVPRHLFNLLYTIRCRRSSINLGQRPAFAFVMLRARSSSQVGGAGRQMLVSIFRSVSGPRRCDRTRERRAWLRRSHACARGCAITMSVRKPR